MSLYYEHEDFSSIVTFILVSKKCQENMSEANRNPKDPEEQRPSRDHLVLMDELPPIEQDSWKWVVLIVATAQSMVLIGVWACGGIYMESMREVCRIIFANFGAIRAIHFNYKLFRLTNLHHSHK